MGSLLSPSPSPYLEALTRTGKLTQHDFRRITAEFFATGATLSHVLLPGSVVTIGYHAPSPTQLAAVSKVFNTIELLELILAHLDFTTLATVVPRVCRGWQKVVQGSVRLSRNAFRAPDTSSWPPHVLVLSKAGRDGKGVLVPGVASAGVSSVKPAMSLGLADTSRFLAMLAPNKNLINAVNISPTLRHTLLTQPPVLAVDIKMTYGPLRQVDCATERLVCQAGVTYGHVADAVERMMARAGKTRFLNIDVVGKITRGQYMLEEDMRPGS